MLTDLLIYIWISERCRCTFTRGKSKYLSLYSSKLTAYGIQGIEGEIEDLQSWFVRITWSEKPFLVLGRKAKQYKSILIKSLYII